MFNVRGWSDDQRGAGKNDRREKSSDSIAPHRDRRASGTTRSRLLPARCAEYQQIGHRREQVRHRDAARTRRVVGTRRTATPARKRRSSPASLRRTPLRKPTGSPAPTLRRAARTPRPSPRRPTCRAGRDRPEDSAAMPAARRRQRRGRRPRSSRGATRQADMPDDAGLDGCQVGETHPGTRRSRAMRQTRAGRIETGTDHHGDRNRGDQDGDQPGDEHPASSAAAAASRVSEPSSGPFG